MGYRLRPLFLLLSLLLVPLVGVAEVAVPSLSAHVTDTIGLLNPGTKQSLESSLKSFETSKGAQVTVLIISTTEGEPIEQFALRVAERWKIGRKKIDDGAILVVAKADRALRIEVGYGLEGALPDATCKQIIENYILPEFRKGDFNAGVVAGVEAILKRLSGEELPPPQLNGSVDWVFTIIIILWVGIILYQIFFNANQGRYYSSRRNSGYWGGSSGGGWSGGGGGGGFSGGGGSFGGGGASGRW
jgi:uncharacterized protein